MGLARRIPQLVLRVALCAAPLAAAAAPDQYSATGIGSLAMEKSPADPNASFAHDVNDAGVVAGQSTTSIGSPPEVATGDFHALRFTFVGGAEDLGDLDGGGDTSAANAINTSGAIAGRADGQRDPGGVPPDVSDATHAARWPAPAALEDIGVATEYSEAYALNGAGNAAGGVGPTGSRQAFFWTPGGGMTPLPAPAGALQVFAEDLNDADRVVGHATLASGERAFLWDAGGSPVDLGDLDGDGGESWAFGVNIWGWIVGSSDDAGQQRAYRRHPETGALMGLDHLPGGDFSRARDINFYGQVVGSAWDPEAREFHAVLWEPDGSAHDLNDLATQGDDLTLEEALAISDTGFIVGQARNASGESEGFVLAPLPEPAGSLPAALAVLVGLAWRRRRAES